MKQIQCILLFVTFVIISKASFAQNNNLSIYQHFFDNQLLGWTKSVTNFNLSTFTKKDTLNFDQFSYGDTTNIKEFYSIYKPIITFSSDKTQFVDIYSYGLNLERKGEKIISMAEAEQGITWCNIKENKWFRILILGTNEGVEDACWIDNHSFILVGYYYSYENKKRIPSIYLINTLKKTVYLYVNNKSVATDYETAAYIKLHVDQ